MKWNVLLYKMGGLERLHIYIKLLVAVLLVFSIVDIVYLGWLPYIIDIGIILFSLYGIYDWIKRGIKR